jgi:hypothetical protein
VRGTAASLLIWIAVCSAAGLAASGVTVLKARAAPDLDGRRIGAWRFEERDGLRTATTRRAVRGSLLEPGGGARPVAYPAGTSPPGCTLPLLRQRTCTGFVSRPTVFEARDGRVVVRLDPAAGGRKADAPGAAPAVVAHAANLRSVLPDTARAWLTQGPADGVLARVLPPVVPSGVLIGAVGGCVCGVYRARGAPSDMMRATSPASTLRTDRTASFTRGGVAALLVACVCVPVVALPGDWGGLVHVGTQLWLPVGTAAPALSAWGRLAVARVWLAATGRTPWRLMALLDEAHRLGVLRRSGAYDEFRHRRLQAHLADGSGAPGGSGPRRPYAPGTRGPVGIGSAGWGPAHGPEWSTGPADRGRGGSA